MSPSAFRAFIISISISTSSGGESDADMSSPSWPDEGAYKVKVQTHYFDDPDVNLDEDTTSSQGLDHLIAKAAAKQR
jgi:hypothetical protein